MILVFFMFFVLVLSLFWGRVVFIFQALKTLASAARLLALPHKEKRKKTQFFSFLFFYPVGDFLQDLCWNLIVAATVCSLIVLCCCEHGLINLLHHPLTSPCYLGWLFLNI